MKKNEVVNDDASQKTPKLRKKLPIVRITCLFTVATLAVTATFAKYVSGTQGQSGAGISPFAASVQVTDQSKLQIFNNSAYEQDGTVINYPQNTPFTIRNYTEDGATKRISQVQLDYKMIFYVPLNFAKAATIQVVNPATQTQAMTAVTPMFLLSDFFADKVQTVALEDGTTTNVYDKDWGKFATTVTSNSNRYGGVTATEKGDSDSIQEETYTRKNENNDNDGLFTNEQGHTIRIERVTVQAECQYSFSAKTIVTGTAAGTTETTTLVTTLPVLLYKQEETVEYLKITIDRGFSLPASGTAIDHNYVFRLTVTAPMYDFTHATDSLDGNMRLSWEDILKNPDFKAEEMKKNLSFRDGSGWAVTSLEQPTEGKSGVTVTYKPPEDKGAPVIYNNVWLGTSGKDNDDSVAAHSLSNGKSYPCRINAFFEQASEVAS